MIDLRIYRLVKRRSPFWAIVWVVAEACRLIFASALFLAPPLVVINIVFSLAQTSWRDALRVLTEWQLYAFLIVISAVNFTLWQMAEYVTSKALCLLGDDDR